MLGFDLIYLRTVNEIFDDWLHNPRIKRIINETRKGDVNFYQPKTQSPDIQGECEMSNGGFEGEGGGLWRGNVLRL